VVPFGIELGRFDRAAEAPWLAAEGPFRWAARSLKAIVVAVWLIAMPVHALTEEPVPPDVQAYLERRRACEHFIGEEPFDEARRRFLQLRILQTCSGINAQGEATRELHKDDPQVLKLLEPHSERIVLLE